MGRGEGKEVCLSGAEKRDVRRLETIGGSFYLLGYFRGQDVILRLVVRGDEIIFCVILKQSDICVNL